MLVLPTEQPTASLPADRDPSLSGPRMKLVLVHPRRRFADTEEGYRGLALHGDWARSAPVELVLEQLQVTGAGLDGDEALRRAALEAGGAAVGEGSHPVRLALRSLWGPIPGAIGLAAALSAFAGRWPELVVLGAILVVNALLTVLEQWQAQRAFEQLQHQLVPRAVVRRNGRHRLIHPDELVPGDVVRLRSGDVVPADVKLIAGQGLTTDESSLTGEPWLAERVQGDVAHAGAPIRSGEMEGVVTATGRHTIGGRTAEMVCWSRGPGRSRAVVRRIRSSLVAVTLLAVAVLLIVGAVRGAPLLEMGRFALVMALAAIPLSLPAALMLSMAFGAHSLAHHGAIVSRPQALEQLAEMDVLCSDKNSTLTLDPRLCAPPIPEAGWSGSEVLLHAALATQREDPDPVDAAILDALEDGAGPLQLHAVTTFTPFDARRKVAEATVQDARGAAFRVVKGAPQVVLDRCDPGGAARERVEGAVQQLAARGMRALGVARSDDGISWSFLGLVPMLDDPRAGTRAAVEAAAAQGLMVRIVTGDHLAIARQTAERLGLGTRIQAVDARFEPSDGFAQVSQDDKAEIVRDIQARGHRVGITGGGVDDLPALRRADVGIALTGATEAARAAADVVVTTPGLAVLVRATSLARQVVSRVVDGAARQASESLRVIGLVTASVVGFGQFPVTALMMATLALLGNLTSLAVALDRNSPDPRPARIRPHGHGVIAVVMGGLGVAETFGLFVLARSWLRLDPSQLQTMIFVALAVAGHLTILVGRVRGPWFTRPLPSPAVLTAMLGAPLFATAAALRGWFVTPIPAELVGLAWAWSLAWFPLVDGAKVFVHRTLDHREKRTGGRP